VVDKCLCSGGARGHVGGAPDMVVHVNVLVLVRHGSRNCVSSGARWQCYYRVRAVERAQGSCASTMLCSDAWGAVIVSIITA
jgi:hypothetical protein